VVRPGGLELPTFWFVARRSIQLSYGRDVADSYISHYLGRYCNFLLHYIFGAHWSKYIKSNADLSSTTYFFRARDTSFSIFSIHAAASTICLPRPLRRMANREKSNQ
jgi:hypothetical protein